jgi:hypothetical protein
MHQRVGFVLLVLQQQIVAFHYCCDHLCLTAFLSCLPCCLHYLQNNVEACGTSCGSLENCTASVQSDACSASCNNGACQFEGCLDGSANCDLDPSNGCEVDPVSMPTRCDAPGQEWLPGQVWATCKLCNVHICSLLLRLTVRHNSSSSSSSSCRIRCAWQVPWAFSMLPAAHNLRQGPGKMSGCHS